MKKCPYCAEEIQDEAIKCKHCGESIGKLERSINNYEVVEALKSPNTCCVWVSLDYWNIYVANDKVIAVRLYRGWWGLVGFIIGLCLYIVTFIITSALGTLLDKSIGEGKCHIMKDKLAEILSNRIKYKIIEIPVSQIKGIQASDLCLGSIWLKYMIVLDKVKLCFENSKYAQMEKIFKLSK